MTGIKRQVSALRAHATGSRHGRHSVSRGHDGRLRTSHPLAGLALADAPRLAASHQSFRRLVLNPEAKATKVETRNGCERSSRKTINHRAGVASRPSGGRSPDGEVSSRSLPTISDTSCGGRAAAAHLAHTQKVEGSSPSPATNTQRPVWSGSRGRQHPMGTSARADCRHSVRGPTLSPGRDPGVTSLSGLLASEGALPGVSSLNLPGSTHHAARPFGRP